MKTVFCFIFVFNLFTASVFAGTRDDSYLGIRAYSNSEVLQIHMIVTDPLGRKNGYTLLPFPHDIYEFQGGYAEEFPMGDEVALEPAGYASISFNHGPVTKGTYTITFCGISDTPVFYEMETHDSDNVFNMPDGKLYTFDGYISSGSVVEYKTYLDPTPGAPAPTIIKEVTFQLLRDDVNVAYKLNQIGDDKFVDSLTRMINLAEKLSIKCDKPKGHDKGHNKKETCKPAIAILNMFIKRLEIANRKCDNKPQFCDEEPEWNNFRKKYGKDKNFKDFFKEWDKDKWHKWKNKCKRFVTDEALKIIKEDAQWLIKSLGGEIDKDHWKGDSDNNSGKEDKKDSH